MGMQQQHQQPEDDWGLGQLTDADIWGNLPAKKPEVIRVFHDPFRRSGPAFRGLWGLLWNLVAWDASGTPVLEASRARQDPVSE